MIFYTFPVYLQILLQNMVLTSACLSIGWNTIYLYDCSDGSDGKDSSDQKLYFSPKNVFFTKKLLSPKTKRLNHNFCHKITFFLPATLFQPNFFSLTNFYQKTSFTQFFSLQFLFLHFFFLSFTTKYFVTKTLFTKKIIFSLLIFTTTKISSTCD